MKLFRCTECSNVVAETARSNLNECPACGESSQHDETQARKVVWVEVKDV